MHLKTIASICEFVDNDPMHGSINLAVTIPPVTSTPGHTPQGKSGPSGPVMGNFFKRSCPGGRGCGKLK